MTSGNYRGISEDERALMTHIMMFGIDGYPVSKQGRGWVWRQWRSVKGAPVVYKTKREAVASFERFHEILCDAKAGRI